MNPRDYLYVCVTITKNKKEGWNSNLKIKGELVVGPGPTSIMQTIADNGGELLSAQYMEHTGGGITSRTHILWVKFLKVGEDQEDRDIRTLN